MDLFTKLNVFENPEINTYLDRMYYFLSADLSISTDAAMELVPITGSVAAILAKKILPRPVKDLDLILNDEPARNYLTENAPMIFGITEDDITVRGDRVTFATPHVSIECFNEPRRGLEPMVVDGIHLIV